MKALLCALLLPGVLAQATTLEITGTIAEAVERAKPGDTLSLQPLRIYREHVVLKKSLRLEGSGQAVLDGVGTGTPLTIEAPDVVVDGLIVRGGGTDLGNFDAGIMVRAPRAVVRGCRVEGGAFGIYIRGVDEALVEGNSVLGNTNVVPSQRGNGIHLWKTRRNTIRGNFITGTRDGAYFSYADRNLIVSNRIEHTRFGIHYMYSHYNRLEENTLAFNAVGAALMFARECAVNGNHAFANRRHGILLKQVERSRFYRNSVVGQNRGFFIQQAVQDEFRENVIAQNDIGLYLSNGSEQNLFTENVFAANADQVWQPPDEVELGTAAANKFSANSRGNYWSDYTGSDGDGNGIGDTPYHETDLYGYLVDRYPEFRVFALSPAAALLRKGEEVLPVLGAPGVTDSFPLVRWPKGLAALLPPTPEIARRTVE